MKGSTYRQQTHLEDWCRGRETGGRGGKKREGWGGLGKGGRGRESGGAKGEGCKRRKSSTPALPKEITLIPLVITARQGQAAWQV